jgi:TolA-binding protein
MRLAVAAGAAFVLGATGAAAAYFGRAAVVPPSLPAPPPRRAAPSPAIVAVPNEPDVETIEPPSVESPRHHRRGSGARDANAAEVALIQRAQAAYADANLPRALQLLAEHGRRFPNGRLAEEREALRVRSLARSGRQADARRALQTFAQRYPHSMLLPHLRETLGDGPTSL